MTYELTERDKQRAAEVLAKVSALQAAIAKVMPELSGEEASEVGYHIGEFWEICRNHTERVDEILKLRGPEDRQRFGKLLEDLFYGDVEAHLQNHVEGMRETLPSVIERLDPEE